MNIITLKYHFFYLHKLTKRNFNQVFSINCPCRLTFVLISFFFNAVNSDGRYIRTINTSERSQRKYELFFSFSLDVLYWNQYQSSLSVCLFFTISFPFVWSWLVYNTHWLKVGWCVIRACVSSSAWIHFRYK